MGDFDSVEQVDRSWFPPHVTCHFTFMDGNGWVERQSAWEYYLPGALLVGAALCVWFATRHRDVKQSSNWPRWRQLVGALTYWALACGTLVGLSAMVWGDDTYLAALPLLAIPALSVWTLQWFWTTTAWPRVR